MEQKVSSSSTVLCVCGPLFSLSWMYLSCLYHSWDEWVPESRVLKYVDSNLAKQKELQKANQ